MVLIALLHLNVEILAQNKTFCSPVNINYMFQNPFRKQSFREGADPNIILIKDKYYLFASKSGGYWYSDDMLDWKFISSKTLPISDYAPTVIEYNNTVYFVASSEKPSTIYFNPDPLEDNWKPMSQPFPIMLYDPNFFKDTDGKLYLYYGCSNTIPLKVVELDQNMLPKGAPVDLIKHNPASHGWEVPGENNEKNVNGAIEGSWVNKFNNKYYLQYASSGTQYKSYANGVYTSNSPFGPYKYENYSPFSYKPGGFTTGTGHGTTFQDKYGNYWHATNITLSLRHAFERRIGLFPAAFDKDGVLRTFTAFGDYPTIVPKRKVNFEKEDLFRGWMLLSYKKKAKASSQDPKFEIANAFDENLKTLWSAQSGDSGEWLSVELDDKSIVNAIQVNFADQGASTLNSKSTNLQYCYKIWASNDEVNWKLIVDKSNNDKDACHDYIELDKAVKAKYIKVENIRVPQGNFSIFDLRIFGLKQGKKPKDAKDIVIERNVNDGRKALVKWTRDNSATGYVVKWGGDKNKLYSSYMVYDGDSVELTGLNKDDKYFYSIDVFNESGITKGKQIIFGN